MKKFLLIIGIFVFLTSFVSCGEQKRKVPEDQVKYDIISTVDSIAKIADNNIEWSIEHQISKNTHSDSLRIYIKDENGVIYENDSYRYTYNYQTDLWTFSEDRVKSWNITKVYDTSAFIDKWLGNHKIIYKATNQSPDYYISMNIYSFDFNKGTVDMDFTINFNTKITVCEDSRAFKAYTGSIKYGRSDYKLSNYVKSLGIYKLNKNEIQIDATQQNSNNLLSDDCLYVDIYNLDNYLGYTRGYYRDNKFYSSNSYGITSEGAIYPSFLVFDINGQISLVEKIKLSGNAGSVWTTRNQLVEDAKKD